MSSNRPGLEDLSGIARDRAMAEACEWLAMLDYRDGELDRIEASDASPMRKVIERSTIAAEIGLHLNLSEGQVIDRLAAGDRLRCQTPRVWLMFQRGVLDAARAREISLAVRRLERPESSDRLDTQVVSYAAKHTLTELRSWLRRFVSRVEADLAVERANAERELRHVEVVQADDSMAWLNAYLPAHEAAAIATRLRKAAKAARAAGDGRTQTQLQADLLTEWTLNADDSQVARGRGLAIDIAVTLDAKVAAGAEPGHAEAADGSWEVPAEWLLDSAVEGDALWHRLLIEPITGNTLAHQYVGYQPPDILRRAIILRDGVCAGRGCVRPAADCDLDHREPWPDGPTSGDNLDPRCRSDHSRKGHGVIDDVLRRLHQIEQTPPNRHRLAPYRPDPVATELAHRLAHRTDDDMLAA
ncbi:HNH endonuclease signature motif containing protein [Aeromicrobium sp. Sec7.5]|uniref:HNH endonuclease signature motif containing protein n=1 Tax=Aeromicrobium sp. Sec7.5 TaxID=3121276 RepID=UPI002FE486D0